jgi:hypothetical protein
VIAGIKNDDVFFIEDKQYKKFRINLVRFQNNEFLRSDKKIIEGDDLGGLFIFE